LVVLKANTRKVLRFLELHFYIICSYYKTKFFTIIFVDLNRLPYLWDYWPHDDGRSNCGYVGLTNLGATCYMASCMQHLFMMPQARRSILEAKCDESNKHASILVELKRMFAYLLV